MARKRITITEHENNDRRAWREFPSRFDPVEPYTPLPVDHDALLNQFAAERAEREGEAFRLAEIRRLIADTADACADGIADATKVLDLGDRKQPRGEETGVAWNDLLETVVDWLGDDATKARPEFVRRMENLIEAVRMDAYSRCLNNVDVLKGEEGVGNL